jgi:hypothetical protein
MKIVFAGQFEIALVRSVDEIMHPQRNASTHEYYAGLNRKVSKSYFDRCGTFIAIADEVLVPQVDWSHRSVNDYELGIDSTDAGGSEWDKDTGAFVKFILKKKVLSPSSLSFISTLSIAHYSGGCPAIC